MTPQGLPGVETSRAQIGAPTQATTARIARTFSVGGCLCALLLSRLRDAATPLGAKWEACPVGAAGLGIG